MAGLLTRITIDARVCGGKPCIRGLRIPVSVVLTDLAAGQTPQQIAEEYPELEVDDVFECLRFAAWLASSRAVDLPPTAVA
jgi:uncharacterized protein (DUF433 family)